MSSPLAWMDISIVSNCLYIFFILCVCVLLFECFYYKVCYYSQALNKSCGAKNLLHLQSCTTHVTNIYSVNASSGAV